MVSRQSQMDFVDVPSPGSGYHARGILALALALHLAGSPRVSSASLVQEEHAAPRSEIMAVALEAFVAGDDGFIVPPMRPFPDAYSFCLFIVGDSSDESFPRSWLASGSAVGDLVLPTSQCPRPYQTAPDSIWAPVDGDDPNDDDPFYIYLSQPLSESASISWVPIRTYNGGLAWLHACVVVQSTAGLSANCRWVGLIGANRLWGGA